jgi:hypothetical protein
MTLSRVLCTFAIPALLCLGCGEEEESTEPEPSVLQKRLSSCPVVSNSSDPSAGQCLDGEYEGETLNGAACSLTFKGGGNYTFESPELRIDYTVNAETIFVFAHSAGSGVEQVAWIIGDGVSVETTYELSFKAAFGENVPAADTKIDIQATERPASGGSQSVACIVEI